ncbi:hypothetical protein NQ317_001037 [Molorchus minor]|uniref:Uncharacterized protein n=1 Tax=Molorchus minor TaxID=1323400 RepID=A0ABQ9IRR2_9CUCU|nr:hypothetical protein NQ317_001037 [Molorchus minor]
MPDMPEPPPPPVSPMAGPLPSPMLGGIPPPPLISSSCPPPPPPPGGPIPLPVPPVGGWNSQKAANDMIRNLHSESLLYERSLTHNYHVLFTPLSCYRNLIDKVYLRVPFIWHQGQEWPKICSPFPLMHTPQLWA